MIVIAVVIYMLVHRLTPSDDLCAETVARLQSMEQADFSAVEAQMQQTQTSSSGVGAVEDADTVAEIQERIRNGEVLDNATIRSVFAGTVIVGDSITESIWEYGYLDQDVVISERGLQVINADDQIATAIYMNPSVIFLAFGSNDLESYISDSDSFINAYRNQIQKLKDALPDVPIYINAILPILDSAIAEIPALGYYPEYNEKLQALCAEMGCTYLDNSFIVEGREDLYEPDGEHVVAEFYPKWLTNMAEMAGLV